MGYYTRVKFRASLRGDTPSEVVDLLSAVADGDRSRAEAISPKHPFFEAPRWMGLLCGTYAAPSWPEADGRLSIERCSDGSLVLAFHSSTKNYDKELDKFCDWLAPHLAVDQGQVVGEFEGEDDAYERRYPTQLIAQVGRIDKLYKDIDHDAGSAAFGGW